MNLIESQKKSVKWRIPIKTISEMNCNEHWTKKSKRHKQQQFFVRVSYNNNCECISLPCTVKLTRLSPYCLDEDNLLAAFKYIRDELSECMIPEKTGSYINKNGKIVKIKGRADSDPRIKWEYYQEKESEQAIQIEIISN